MYYFLSQTNLAKEGIVSDRCDDFQSIALFDVPYGSLTSGMIEQVRQRTIVNKFERLTASEPRFSLTAMVFILASICRLGTSSNPCIALTSAINLGIPSAFPLIACIVLVSVYAGLFIVPIIYNLHRSTVVFAQWGMRQPF